MIESHGTFFNFVIRNFSQRTIFGQLDANSYSFYYRQCRCHRVYSTNNCISWCLLCRPNVRTLRGLFWYLTVIFVVCFTLCVSIILFLALSAADQWPFLSWVKWTRRWIDLEVASPHSHISRRTVCVCVCTLYCQPMHQNRHKCNTLKRSSLHGSHIFAFWRHTQNTSIQSNRLCRLSRLSLFFLFIQCMLIFSSSSFSFHCWLFFVHTNNGF